MSISHYFSRVLRGARRRLFRINNDRSAWTPLLRQEAAHWDAAREAARDGQRVLMATSIGGYPFGATLESALAVALTLRGARVDILLCDSFLPACQLTEPDNLPPERLSTQDPPQPRCAACWPPGRAMFEALNLPLLRYSQFVTPAERAEAKRLAADVPATEIRDFQLDGRRSVSTRWPEHCAISRAAT